MPPQSSLTPAQLVEIAAARARGESVCALAARYGRSTGCISYRLRQMGVQPPVAPPVPGLYVRRPALRRGRLVRPYEPWEDKLLIQYRRDGVRMAEAARRLRRALSSVHARYATLESRAERGEIPAEGLLL